MSVPENRVLGSYRLIERIGKGGMGEVYRAEHLKLGREAAVKVLPSNLVNEADFLKRFEREASSAARLEHPNILPVYEYGDQPTPYLVMPYVKGGTLKDKMSAGKLSQAEITNYLRQMADALDYAHEKGIIHRDVKPANMLLDERGRLYLGDFGIAKALEGAEGLTRTGVGVGTPEYMAPEQAQGRADSRSDLYALGIILYQMLTGRVPYSGNSTVEVLMKHLQDPLPMLPLRSVQPALPARVEQIIQKALAKNPNDRYGSGRAMVEDFAEAMAAGPSAGAAATIVAPGLGGAPTVVSNTPLPPSGFGAPPPGNTPLPPLTPPPVGPPQSAYGAGNTGQPTVLGGPPPYGGNTPPQFASNTPPPLGQAPPIYSPQPQRPAQSSGGNRGLIIGGAVAALVALIACVSIGAFALTRNSATPTPVVNANATASASAVAAANLAATQTAGAPRPSAAASAPASAPASAAASIPAASAGASAAASAPASAAPTASASVAPSAAPSAAPSVAPTPRPSAAAPSVAGNRAPIGAAPAGWKTYSGTARVPFAMYYPPGWTVDDSRASEGRVYFYGPGVKEPLADALWVMIATTGVRDPNGNIDVLRDQYFKEQILDDYPDATLDVTRNNRFSNIIFASLGTIFQEDGQNCYAYIGLGLNNQVPWRFRLNSLYNDYDKNLEAYFNGMIGSMNIYANP